MYIIIVGGGKVGMTLAENLSADGHEITLIDTRESVLQRADDTLDIMCIPGNGASIGVLQEARVDRADLLIAVTGRDELNMLCCLTSKKLGAKNTIARIRDMEYADEIDRIKKDLDIDLVVNPEESTAMQISRLLRFPLATDIDVFYRGRIEMVAFRVEEGDMIAGSPLSTVRRKFSDIPVLFCAAEHNGVTYIPHGNSVFEKGDRLYVIGSSMSVNRFFRTLGRLTQPTRSVFLVGGGRTGYYLARILSDMNIGLKIIEIDRDKSRALAELLPKTLIVEGDGSDHELLAAEHLELSDAFVALTGRDEDNLVTSLYAKKAGVKKVVAKIDRQDYNDLVRELNIDSIVNPKSITADAILHYVRATTSSRGGHMEALYRIGSGAAEATEFTVGPGTAHMGVPLKDLNSRLKAGVLVAVIVRNGRFIIPEGGDSINEGDNVIIVSTTDEPIMDINDIFVS